MTSLELFVLDFRINPMFVKEIKFSTPYKRKITNLSNQEEKDV